MEVSGDVSDTPGAPELFVDDVVVDLLLYKVIDAEGLRAESTGAGKTDEPLDVTEGIGVIVSCLPEPCSFW